MRYSTKPRNIFVACLMLGVLAGLLFAAPGWAQVAGATLSGEVTDASGAVIPQAQVAVKNLGTGITTTVAVNADGFYSAPNLLPGTYEMTCSAPGFTTEVRSGITLEVGAQQVLNFSLKVGQVTEKVQVTGEAPAVQLASSSISAVVSSNAVVELPLNGRDWASLATLQPAVNAIETQQPNGVNASRANRGFGNQLSISGTRPQLNNYRLDGISIVDYAGGSPGSVLGVTLGVDAIAEFSVLTSNYDASYGRTSGGVINAITKAGTNQFHGDAYEFLRNSALDARQFFDSTIPPFRRNQFGGSAGGPIQKDKTFFFADYEGLRQALSTTNVDLVPSPDARNGILHNADGSTTTVTVDPAVAAYIAAFYPLPNAGLVGTGNTGHFDIPTNNISTENFITTRIDRKFSDKDSISGTWFWDKGLNDTPDALDQWILGNKSLRTMVALEETHVFSPSLVNSVRGGYSRVHEIANTGISVINPLAANTTTFSAFPGQVAPGVSVPGLTTFAGGIGGLSSPDHVWNSFQGYDDAFLTKGTHSIKFGFAFERMEHQIHIPGTSNGNFKFGSLEGFLTNLPSSLTAKPGFIREFGARQSLVGGYFQDDWRLRPNLTVNLGLRYEMVTVPTEVHNFLSNLPIYTASTPNLGSPYFNNPTLRNFEPRVGFAWDPFHDGKTAVRGAFGLFDALPLNYEFYVQEANSAPFGATTSASPLPAGSFPAEAGLLAVTSTSGAGASIQFNPPRNYVLIWNLNIQHQITPSTALTVGYVGNHGVHMENKTDDVNMVDPTLTPDGYLWPFPAGSGTRINPAFGQIRGTYWGGTALYDALEVQLAKRMSHGFQVQGSYTWGKDLDTGSASVIGDPFTNSITSLLWFCNQCRKGFSDFNIAQTLSVNYIWDIPTPKNWGGVAAHVLGGWEVGGIITAETGVPITPLIGGDPLGQNSSDPFDYPDRLTGPGCQSPVNPGNPNNYIKLNCFGLPTAPTALLAECSPFAAAPGTCANLFGNGGRNEVVGPGLATWDFSLFKNNYIKKVSENFNVQFRLEVFNILNKPNFGTPVDNSTLFTSSGTPVGGAGAVDNTSTAAREIQFALKLIW